jgi:hypothetical protein
VKGAMPLEGRSLILGGALPSGVGTTWKSRSRSLPGSTCTIDCRWRTG